jgi:hypothetical protein
MGWGERGDGARRRMREGRLVRDAWRVASSAVARARRRAEATRELGA